MFEQCEIGSGLHGAKVSSYDTDTLSFAHTECFFVSLVVNTHRVK